jgi:hypothetical protein
MESRGASRRPRRQQLLRLSRGPLAVGSNVHVGGRSRAAPHHDLVAIARGCAEQRVPLQNKLTVTMQTFAWSAGRAQGNELLARATFRSGWSTSAPAASSRITTVLCPPPTAQYNGVVPSLSAWSASAPAASSITTTPWWLPARAAVLPNPAIHIRYTCITCVSVEWHAIDLQLRTSTVKLCAKNV